MDKAESFTDYFSQDPEKVSHLIEIKYRYKKLKYLTIVLFSIMYAIAFVLSSNMVSDDNMIFLLVFSVVFLSFSASGIMMIILYFDSRGYELSNEELVCHEFTEAINEYQSDKPNYEEWKSHLCNVKKLIQEYDSNVFSKFRTEKVVTYIDRIEETDGDNVSKSSFEAFHENILVDLYDERVNEYNNTIDELKIGKEPEQGSFSVYKQSLKNLYNRWRIGTLGPIFGALGLGISVYFLYDKELGSLLSIALLTVISILLSREE